MDMTDLMADVALAFLLMGFLLLAAQLIRLLTPGLRKIFLPVALIAGTLGLLLGPEGPATLIREDGLIPGGVHDVWRALPELLISVVFAAMFLGKRLPSIPRMWHVSGPQVMLGHTLAWGQYVIGIGLAWLVLGPIWGTSPMAGTLLEIGFVGGHGTVAGMSRSFETFDFPEGTDLGLGLATVGIVAGSIFGTVLLNWAQRSSHVQIAAEKQDEDGTDQGLLRETPNETDDDTDERIEPPQVPGAEGQSEGTQRPVDPLSVHLAILGLAIGIGWLLLQSLQWVERATWGRGDLRLVQDLPLFPLAMIGAMLLQIVLDRIGYAQRIDRRLINRISGASLDLIITAAIATLSLAALGAHWGPLLVLATAGIAWNVGGFLLLAPRMIPKHWFERGVGDFGQSIGMAALGLLLIRLADPQNKTRAAEGFGYKQALFEPLLGGGLFTAAALPLIAQFGQGTMLVVVSLLTLAFLLGGLRLGRQKEEDSS